MNKRLNLLPVWAAVAAVIIIAGIVLMALLGFNVNPDRPDNKYFDVHYNVIVDNVEENKNTLAVYCEEAFATAGIKADRVEILEGQSDPVSQTQGDFAGTGNDFVVRYTFAKSVSDEALATARDALMARVEGNAAFAAPADVYASFHTDTLQPMNEGLWRAAVGIAVAVVVALIYVAIRFGMGCAITGLVNCVCDAFLTLSVLAIARIPVYLTAPMLYAAVAAALSLVFWLIRSMKLRDDAKDPTRGGITAEEAVRNCCKGTDEFILGVAAILFVLVAICTGISTTSGAALLFAGVFLPVAASLYSSMLLGPALHVKVKAHFDRRKRKSAHYEGNRKVKD